MASPASKHFNPSVSKRPETRDLDIASSLTDLRGVGAKRAQLLAESGLFSPREILFHIPHRYEDRRAEMRIVAVESAGSFVFRGVVSNLKQVRIRKRRLTMVRGQLEDGTGFIPIVWFNRPYLMTQIEEDHEYVLYGTVRATSTGFELLNPTLENPDSVQLSGKIVPIYSSVGSLSAGFLRNLVWQVLDRVDLELVTDPVPREYLDRHTLPNLAEALYALHKPALDSDLEDLNGRKTKAHQRLSYAEFLDQQLELRLLRSIETRRTKAQSYCLTSQMEQRMFDIVPFQLTSAQNRAFDEIKGDLMSPSPMLRLLQGDVGCGKTIVAALALVLTLENGFQGALMAPTEILAEQHYRTFRTLLGDRYRLALMTRSVDAHAKLENELAAGDIQLVVGTHALIQESIKFKSLGLAVVDEQHRFGVAQRKLLQKKGATPDMLVMTATPIPRSLALTVYGDLALSVIDQLPPGRSPIRTRVVPKLERDRVYDWLKDQLDDGAQAYVVTPLIDDSPTLGAESISSTKNMLDNCLVGHRIESLHGRTNPSDRESTMDLFMNGDIRLLLATSVIEVGLDVANASVMIIENAERFGLAQLHQLRGRVGRGSRPSFCVAIHGSLSSDAQRRLEVFEASSDGFHIAEADLKIRGPGEVLGTRQSGIPQFRIADVLRDHALLEAARNDAWQIVEDGAEAVLDPEHLQRLKARAYSRHEVLSGG